MNPTEESHRTSFESTEQLLSTVWKGSNRALEAWLARGHDPNTYDAEGWTPLLAACARGNSALVGSLLNSVVPATTKMPHRETGALPIHMAGQSGSVEVAEQLLGRDPGSVNAIWYLNGHTLLLQATFFNHPALVKLALERRANTAATTVRGLSAIELAEQFNNTSVADMIRPYRSSAEDQARYYQRLLREISPINDRLANAVSDGVMNRDADAQSRVGTMQLIRRLVEEGRADVNALGGPLQQPPLIVAVTGTDGEPTDEGRRCFRLQIVKYLLEKGASPLVRERHPMAVNAIIRAAVFNHLEALRLMAEVITADQLESALNERPAVNGLTALHDTVLRASTVTDDRLAGYLEQIHWCISNGAGTDIKDFSGLSQRDIALSVSDANRRDLLLQALSRT